MRAIIAVDPGGHTGIAWGIFNDKAPTVKEALQGGLEIGSATIEGPTRTQVPVIAFIIREFRYRMIKRRCMEPEWVDVVFEDFILQPGAHAGGRTGIVPLAIMWGVIGWRDGQAHMYEQMGFGKTASTDIIMQPPSDAARFATDGRLKSWGLWVKGREHERSAFRHIALRLSRLMGQRR